MKIPVLNVVGSRCKPEEEKKFNKWYDEVHIPMLMRFKDLVAVSRFKIIKESPDYPTYLAIYEFVSQSAYEAYQKRPDFPEAQADIKENWPNGLDIKWRVQYEFIRSWTEELESEGEGSPVINFVGTRAKPQDEVRFNQWYDNTHIPGLLSTRRIKEAVRYKIVKESKEHAPYLTIYFFPNQKAYDEYFRSPARLQAIKEMEAEWPNNRFDIVWRAQYRLLKSWKK
jgi:quinol monooxygenase YgiN